MKKHLFLKSLLVLIGILIGSVSSQVKAEYIYLDVSTYLQGDSHYWYDGSAWFQVHDGASDCSTRTSLGNNVWRFTTANKTGSMCYKRMQPNSTNQWNYANVTVDETSNIGYITGWNTGSMRDYNIQFVNGGGEIYFDNTPTQWNTSYIYFVIGRDHNTLAGSDATYFKVYAMSRVNGTELWHVSVSDTWNDAEWYGVIGSNSEVSNGVYTSSKLAEQTKFTAAYTNVYNLNSGSNYLLTPESGDNGTDFDITYYGNLTALKKAFYPRYITVSATLDPSTITPSTNTDVTFNLTTNVPTSESPSFYFQMANWGAANSGAAGAYNMDGDHQMNSTSNPSHTKSNVNLSEGTYKTKIKITWDGTDIKESELISLNVVNTNKTLAYNDNGKTGGGAAPTGGTYSHNSVQTVAGNTNTMTKDNYTFAGWNTNATISGTAYAASSSITMDQDYTLYAKWTQTITLHANTDHHGTGDNSSATAVWNKASLEGFSATSGASGYTLDGYYTAETSGTKILNADGSFADDNITGYTSSGKWSHTGSAPTLYAHWVADTWDLESSSSADLGRFLNTAEDEYQMNVYVDNTFASTPVHFILNNNKTTWYYADGNNPTTTDITLAYGTGNQTWQSEARGYYTLRVWKNGSWKYHAYASPQVNYTASPTGGSVEASSNHDGDINAGDYVMYGSDITFEATPSSGYTFEGWYAASDFSGDRLSTSSSLTVSGVTSATGRYAKFAEDTKTLVPTVNSWGTTAGYLASATNSGTIGVATTTTLTCSDATTGFSFSNWTLTNLTVTAGSSTSTSVTVKITDPTQPFAAVANYAEDFSTPYVIKGGTAIAGGEGWDVELVMRKRTGHTTEPIAYDTITLSGATPSGAQTSYNFKIVQKSTDSYWGIATDNHSTDWQYYRNYGVQTLSTGGGVNDNIQLHGDMAGDYIVKVDYSDDENPTVEIIFPINGRYNVTLTKSGHGSVENEGTLEIHEAPKVAISAAVETGYRFTGWTVDSDHSSYISFDNSSSTSTNVWATSASAAGATITANFTTDGIIYIDKSAIASKWGGGVWVYFYSSPYWSDTDGSGSQSTGAITVYGPYPMNRLGDSQIYYYDYSTTPGSGTTLQYVAFTDREEGNWPNFGACSAIYRGDFYPKMPMFVVRDYMEYHNTNACYYNKGYWRKYNDTDPGYVVKIYNDWNSSGKANLLGTYPLSSIVEGSASAEATVSLNSGTNYFKIVGCDTTTINGVNYAGTYYRDSRNGTMDTDNSDNWALTDESGSNTGVLATASGDYNFRLTLGGGTLYISVDFPLNVGDFRVVYNGKMQTTAGSKKDHPSNYIRKLKQPTVESDTTKTDIVSFFVDPSTDNALLAPEIRFQWCAGFSGYDAIWRDTLPSAKINLSGITEVGIYNFEITQTNTQTASTHTISGAKMSEPYSGNFYIRTNEAKGGWKSYMHSIDNRMTYSDFSKSHSGYDYYNCHYIETEKNVKFTIANDYNECITDTLYGDDYVDAGTQELPYQANVRFMYNSQTNVIGRAYLNGSSDGAAEYLKIASDPSRTSTTSATKAERAEILDDEGELMVNNDTTFRDLGNWVYQIDLQVLEGARVKLTSDYRYGGVSHLQYFKGAEGDWSNAYTTQILGGSTNTYNDLRIIYDFKTNHLLSAWLVATNKEISGKQHINTDVLILRSGHDDAKQLTFGAGAELDDVDTVYAALELKKSHILGNGSQASREFYWVSFPYNVKINDIFGSVGNFNIDWAIQYYNGKKRAQNGYWIDSEPNWEFFESDTATLKANEGYVLTLALSRFLTTGTGSKWDNDVDSLYLYFPSAGRVGTILKTDTTLKIDTVGYKCTIDRRSESDKTNNVQNINKNRTIADSHWHCIGIPSFANSTRQIAGDEDWTDLDDDDMTPEEDDIPAIAAWTSPSLLYLYAWDMEDNKLTPVAASSYSFKAMHAYLVQYGNDTIQWNAVSTPNGIAARRISAIKDQEFRLEVRRNDVVEDHTYIRLSDKEGVTTGFEFGQDLSKELNKNSANIYTFADYVPVAGNSMPLETEQTTIVPMGVKIATNGEYTLSMPEGTNGIGVILVDNVTGTRTNLALTDYTVTLANGTYDGRFTLEVSAIQQTPTDVENGVGANGVTGVRKAIVDGVLYIVKDGVVFDARGNRVQ